MSHLGSLLLLLSAAFFVIDALLPRHYVATLRSRILSLWIQTSELSTIKQVHQILMIFGSYLGRHKWTVIKFSAFLLIMPLVSYIVTSIRLSEESQKTRINVVLQGADNVVYYSYFGLYGNVLPVLDDKTKLCSAPAYRGRIHWSDLIRTAVAARKAIVEFEQRLQSLDRLIILILSGVFTFLPMCALTIICLSATIFAFSRVLERLKPSRYEIISFIALGSASAVAIPLIIWNLSTIILAYAGVTKLLTGSIDDGPFLYDNISFAFALSQRDLGFLFLVPEGIYLRFMLAISYSELRYYAAEGLSMFAMLNIFYIEQYLSALKSILQLRSSEVSFTMAFFAIFFSVSAFLFLSYFLLSAFLFIIVRCAPIRFTVLSALQYLHDNPRGPIGLLAVVIAGAITLIQKMAG